MKFSKEDLGEMRTVAAAAVGLFPRIQVDPAHVLVLIDQAASPRVVHVVTLIDRHFDDVTTVCASKQGADDCIARIKEQYADDMARFESEWSWSERAKTWSAYDDGPRIRVEQMEMQP